MWRHNGRGNVATGPHTIPYDGGHLVADLLWIDAERPLRLMDLKRRGRHVEAPSTLVVVADHKLMREMAKTVERFGTMSPGWLKASVARDVACSAVGSGFSAQAQVVAGSGTAVMMDYQWNAGAPALVVAELWSCGEHRHAGTPLMTAGSPSFLTTLAATLRALSAFASPASEKSSLTKGPCLYGRSAAA